MNFRNGNYITTNWIEFIEIIALFFHIENCSFVLNHCCKLALDLNQHFLLFINKFSTIFQDKINDFYLIYNNLYNTVYLPQNPEQISENI